MVKYHIDTMATTYRLIVVFFLCVARQGKRVYRERAKCKTVALNFQDTTKRHITMDDALRVGGGDGIGQSPAEHHHPQCSQCSQ